VIRSRSGEAVVRWLLERRGRVLLVFAAALLLAAASIGRAVHAAGRVPIDNSLEIWFLEDDPALTRYREFLADWGNDEAVVVGLFDPDGVLRPETLDLLADLSERLERLEHVEGVTSLATVVPVRNDAEGTLVIDRLYEAPVDPADLEAIRARIAEDPLYREHLLAPDGRATLLSVQLETSPEFDRLRRAILAEVRATIEATLREAGRDPDADWAWGGIGVIHVALNRLVMSDAARFTVLTTLLLVLGLGVAFRRVAAVAACLLSVGSATLLLLGAYFGTGLSLNMVTMVLPTLVMVVGLTDSVYFLMTFQLLRSREPEAPVREAVVEALGFCFWPGLFNSITTSVGFLAFLSAHMEVVRHLGVFAGVGVACAFLSSLVVCSLVIDRFPGRVAPRAARTGASPGAGARAFAWLARAVPPRRRLLLAASALVAGLAALGISRLRVDSYSLAYFYPDHEIRADDAALLDAFGPYLPLELVVHTPAPGDVKRPDVLRGVESLIAEVIAEEETVARAISLSAVGRRLYRVFADDPAGPIPASRDALEQLFLFYDPLRPGDPVQLTDAKWQSTRFQFKIENEGARAGRELLERIHARAPDHLPPDVELVSGGYMPLYGKLIDHLVWGQVTSIAITVVVVFCLIALLFRSLHYALLSVVPNVLPVAATLGLMGALGINLDVATVLVAAIALGVAVDDTIHFLFKFRAALAASGDPEQAVRDTLTTTGRAITATSAVVILGFAVLCMGQIMTVALFGLLLCTAMLAALVAELFVTPALLLTFPPPPNPDREGGPSEPRP